MKKFVYVMLLAFLFLAFFYREVLGGFVYYCCDNLLITIPSRLLYVSSLRDGIFPLWNSRQFSGTPFWADLNLGLASPLNLLYLVFSPFRALTVSLLTLLLTGLYGGYFLGRSLRLSRPAAAVVAALFGFSGSLLTFVNNQALLATAALTPWVMGTWIWYQAKPISSRYLLLVGSLVVQILFGHPQITYYTLLVCLGWALIFAKKTYQLVLFDLVKIFGFAGLVTLVQTLPFVEFVVHSTRTSSFQYAASGSIHPFSLVRLIFPGVTGSWSEGTAWVQIGSVHGYVSLIGLSLTGLVLVKLTRRIWFWAVVGMLSLVLAFGKYTPIYFLFYKFLPGFGLFREPGQLLFLWTLSMSVLGGFGAELVMISKLYRCYFIYLLISVSLIFVSVGVGVGWLGEDGLQLVSSQSWIPALLVQKITSMTIPQLAVTINYFARTTIFVGLTTGLAAISSVLPIARKTKIFLLILIITSELMVVTGSARLITTEKNVSDWWRAAAWQAGFLPENPGYRYYVDPVSYWAPRIKRLGQFGEDEEAIWQLTILRPGLLSVFGRSVVDGYGSLVLGKYQKFFADATDPTGLNIGSNFMALNQAGVRYVIGPDNPEYATGHSEWAKKKNLLGGLALYENPQALPRIYFADDPRGEKSIVSIVEESANQLTIVARRKQAGLLTIMLPSYPGWQVYLDGVPTKKFEFNNVFVAIWVPDGQHKVELKFNSLTFVLGLLGTGLGLVILVSVMKQEIDQRREIHQSKNR